MLPKKISELVPIVKLEPVPEIVAIVPLLKLNILPAPVILILPVVSKSNVVVLPAVKVDCILQHEVAAGVAHIAQDPAP